MAYTPVTFATITGDKFWLVHVILTHRPFSSSLEANSPLSPHLGGMLEEDQARNWINNRFLPVLQSAGVRYLSLFI